MPPNNAEQKFAAAVEAIYDAAPDITLWPAALDAIAGCFEDVGTVLLYSRDDGSVGTICSPALDRFTEAYQGEWSSRDLRNARGLQRWARGMPGRKDAITDRDVVTPDEIATHPIYTEFLVPAGLGWFAAVAISPDPRVLVWISVQRSSKKQPFTEEELALLTRLSHHAEKALRLGIRLLNAELVNLKLGEALGRIGIGVFALDSLSRVVFLNPKGQSLLGDGLWLDRDRLRIGGSSQNAAIVEWQLGNDQDALTRRGPILIARQRTDRPLVLYALPIGRGAAATAQDFLTHARSILLAIDPEPGEAADPALVRDLLDLTLAEARLASLVASGLTLRQSAEKLGIAEETARTVLKRVFSKTGVSRQSELVGLLTRLVLQ